MKDLTTKQIERLAIKNRKAAEDRLRGEQAKRGVDKTKKRDYVYVNRTVDERFADVDHRSLFREMKKPPFQD